MSSNFIKWLSQKEIIETVIIASFIANSITKFYDDLFNYVIHKDRTKKQLRLDFLKLVISILIGYIIKKIL